MKLKALAQLLLTPLPSWLKVAGYRLLGARIGAGVRIAPFAVLVADDIDIGPMARIKPLTLITGLSGFKMGAYAGISNLCVINGPSSLHIGPRSFVGPGCMIDLDDSVSIGEYSGVSPRTTILTHGVFFPASWGYRRKIAPVAIGDLVWISNNCKIGAGVTIASDTVILPSSTVSSDVKSSCMLHDSSLKRTHFSIHLIRKKVCRARMDEFITEVTTAMCKECFEVKGWHAMQEEGRTILQSGRRRIAIEREGTAKPCSGGPPSDESWLFGYELNDAVLGGGGSTQALDFLRLLHSPNAGGPLRAATRYFQHSWGLRFADWRYREHFRLTPPSLDQCGPPQSPGLGPADAGD